MKHYYTRRVGGKKIVCAKTPQGQGMFTFGEDPRQTIKRAMMMRGKGMNPHGAGFLKDIGKAFEKTAKTITKIAKAPATKKIIKAIRKTGSPFVRSALSKGMEALPGLLAMNPKTAALAPVAQMATPLAKKGITKGLDLAESQAEKHGYGYQASKMGRGLYDQAPKGGAIQRNDGLKYKRNQFGKYNHRRTITQETFKKLPHIAVGARVHGAGLKPL